MKKSGWIVVAFCAVGMLHAAPLNEREARIVKMRLVPAPRSVELTDGPDVVIDGSLNVTLACAKDGPFALKQTAETLKAWFGVEPELKAAAVSDRVPQQPDAYRITTSRGALTIEAADAGGARNALRTLRQLAEPMRGTRGTKACFVPELVIDDAPAMAFRGFHICWFPENTPVQIERFIRLAAYYKLNRVVLEPWGTFVSEKHPGLAWPGGTMTVKEIKRLVKIADGLGVTLIPQFNLFGHASGARMVSGKHAALDFRPELQPLFEPLGWTWCLSNPETLRLLEEVTLEMHDAFGRPPYFHAGCDEADEMGTCAVCRRSDFPRAVTAALTRIHGALAARGCRMMVWHDMLLKAGDPRWKGYTANGAAWAETLLDALPRDVVICDWYYDAPKKEGGWPTLRHFREKGFPVLACPWENLEGYRGLSQAVRDEKLEGMLCTAWHHLYGTSMMQIYFRAAHATWGTPPLGGHEHLVFGHHLRQIGWDVPVKAYEDTGNVNTQLPEKTATPW
jgi:N-acetyl-beta-hexosaminidase